MATGSRPLQPPSSATRGFRNGVTVKESGALFSPRGAPHLREIIPPFSLHGGRHRGTILRFQKDPKGVPSGAARMPCRLRISRPAAEEPDALTPLEEDRRSRATARKTRFYPGRLHPPNPRIYPRFHIHLKHRLFAAWVLWVPFKLTLPIRSARRRSRSSTHKRSRKLPESSARKRINSGIKIRNTVSRKACGFLSWTEECVGGGPSRRKASRVWKKVIGGCCQ